MKLEINPIAKPNTGSLVSEDVNSLQNENVARASEALKRGISAAKAGNRHEARTLLLRVTESDSKSETAWLWLASISEYPEELLVFLQNVLAINPDNQRALDWTKQTKTLLAKNFVQRGIAASQENQKHTARQSFLQAIGHDSQNEMAWLWLASIVDAAEEKISHLQKVLAINPENPSAIASLKSIKHQIGMNLLKKANQAFVSGNRERAKSLVEQTIGTDETIEDAWILKAHLADSFDEKVLHFKRVLDTNPDNQAAQSGLMSVQSVMQSFATEAEAEDLDVSEEVSNEVAEITETAESVELVETVESVELVEETQPENEVEVAAETTSEIHEAEEPQTEVEEQLFVNEEVVEYQENAAEEVGQVEIQAHEEVETQIEIHATDEVEASSQTFAEAESKTPEAIETEQPAIEEVATAAESEIELVAEESRVEEFVAQEVEQEVEQEFVSECVESNEAVEVASEVAPELVETQSQLEVAETVEESQLEAEIQETASEDSKVELAEVVAGIPVEPHHEEADYKSHEFALQEEILDIKPVQRENSQVGVYSFSKFGDGESQANSETVALHQGRTEVVEETSVQAEETHQEVACTQTEITEVAEVAEITEVAEVAEVAETVEVAAELEEAVHLEAVNEEVSQEETVYAEAQAEVTHRESLPVFEEHQSANQTGKLETQTSEVVEEAKVEFAPEARYETLAAAENTSECPFCEAKNIEDSVKCKSCHAVLDMSDLDLILENTLIDSEVVFQSIQSMELDKLDGEFSDENYTKLGMAYLNVKDLKHAHENLKMSLHLNPMKVSLSYLVKEIDFRLKAEVAHVEEVVAEVKSEGRTIMVVDDSPTVRKLISSKLERHGHTVVSAVDGMDALAKINEVTPDLILLDITMPKLDGYQVCKLIRSNDATKGIPVIMISGKDGFFDKVRGKMAGSNGFISKPFGPEILMKTLNTFAR
jgi:CheY-like chemotaxis protein